MKYRFLILLFTLLVSTSHLYSQTASISGYVKDSSNKETLIGATIRIAGTKKGAQTNKDGYYVISNLKPGKYNLIFSYIGYEEYNKEITLKVNQDLRIDALLHTGSMTSEEISVYGDRNDDKVEISISKVNIPIQQIKEIRIGGESDIFRSLQLLPGVLTSSQISSGLYIRGGSPDQNLVLLDGSMVYNPTHLFGFISAFNTDAIKDVELIKGGFNAEYGGRLSSVLTLTQKDGNREEVEGLFSVGAISSKLALEGPIGNGSWFIGGRRTYFELIKAFLSDDPLNPIPDFNFYDVNAKITQDFGDNDKIAISGFYSKDNLDYDAGNINFNLGISNRLGSARWTHIFNPQLFSTVNLSTSQYINGFDADNSGYKVLQENIITDYTIKHTLDWFHSEEITTKYGYEVNFYEFDYLANFTGSTDSTAEGSGAGRTNLHFTDRNYAAFAQAKWQINTPLSAQFGLRGNYFEFADQAAVEPRIALKYYLQPDVAIKASWGIYHQNLKLATLQDFSFFDTWLGTDSSLNIGKSIHYILSLETEPWDGYDLNVDVYYKSLENINEIRRVVLQIDNGADVLYEGKGEAFGAELFIQKKIGDFTGWFGYGLGFINAQYDSLNSGRYFRPKFDRRHDIKGVIQYKIDENWDVGANFTFQSGQSYTGQTSRFQLQLEGETNGRGKTVPSQRYGLRLPPSHQLNLNGSYKFKAFGYDAKILLDIYNVYNRRDIWFRFYNVNEETTTVEDFRLLPIIPTFSFEIKF
ncbi:MAG: TonB-dependent receptor [Ignavibacteriae bacterium]|nr:TonB-dependent receptor [Ignavibacteriota bacterium]MCB9220328.1 TonB-dependent receptor [Ignavibacteria bacterium]